MYTCFESKKNRRDVKVYFNRDTIEESTSKQWISVDIKNLDLLKKYVFLMIN